MNRQLGPSPEGVAVCRAIAATLAVSLVIWALFGLGLWIGLAA